MTRDAMTPHHRLHEHSSFLETFFQACSPLTFLNLKKRRYDHSIKHNN